MGRKFGFFLRWGGPVRPSKTGIIIPGSDSSERLRCNFGSPSMIQIKLVAVQKGPKQVLPGAYLGVGTADAKLFGQSGDLVVAGQAVERGEIELVNGIGYGILLGGSIDGAVGNVEHFVDFLAVHEGEGLQDGAVIGGF